jgi:GNAT superfamily N-acetyltransferase
MTVECAMVHHPAPSVPSMRAELVDVYADSHADLLCQPFFSVERYWQRVEGYIQGTGFDLVTGRVHGLLVGYTFGSALPAGTGWWTRLQEATEPDVTRETGTRTFALREFMVRQAHQGRGYGRALHDEILAGRPEQRATLLVRIDNPVRQLYLRWGWSVVGSMRPFPDSPIMHAMIKPLSG